MESEQTRTTHTYCTTNRYLTHGGDRFHNPGPRTPRAHRYHRSKAFSLTNSTGTGLPPARNIHLHLLGRHRFPPRKCRPSALPCDPLRHLRPPYFASLAPTALHNWQGTTPYLQRHHRVGRWMNGSRRRWRRYRCFDACDIDGYRVSSSTTEI